MGRARLGERGPSSPGPARPPAAPPRRARALALFGALIAAAAAAAAARAYARHTEAQAAARQVRRVGGRGGMETRGARAGAAKLSKDLGPGVGCRRGGQARMSVRRMGRV